jgi:hypothetical protein
MQRSCNNVRRVLRPVEDQASLLITIYKMIDLIGKKQSGLSLPIASSIYLLEVLQDLNLCQLDRLMVNELMGILTNLNLLFIVAPCDERFRGGIHHL